MTSKDFIPRLLDEVKLRWPLPSGPKKDLDLLEQGGVVMLMRHLTEKQAETSILALKGAYEDWNEVRVSQVQEISGLLDGGKKSAKSQERTVEAARTLKEYLQEVFQKTHGLELEFMREDIAGAAKLIGQMPVLGQTAGSYLMWLASGEEIPVHLSLMRFLERLGLIGRTTSVPKATAAIGPLVPKGRGLDFTAVFHEVLERWADPDKPIFEEVAVLRECPYGKKAYQERQAALARQEAQRKRDEERRKQQLKREEEQRKKEEAKARKKAEAQAKREAREAEKRRRAQERKAKAEAKRKEAEKAAKKKAAEKARQLAAKKREAERKKAAAAKKKATAKKKAAAKKKTTAKKKAAAKKKTTKKATARKKPAAKASNKKAAKKTTKKAAAKKSVRKKTSTRKTTRKKAPARTTKKASASKSRAKTTKKKSKTRRR